MHGSLADPFRYQKTETPHTSANEVTLSIEGTLYNDSKRDKINLYGININTVQA